MRLNSLAFRLFASASAWTLIVLPATAILLTSLYRNAVERNFDARLNVYLTSLVAATTAAGGTQPKAPANLGEAVFNLPFSGWYWQIKRDGSARPLLVSDSLLDQQLKLPSQSAIPPDQTLTRRAYADGPEQQRLRVLEREIRPDGDYGTTYSTPRRSTAISPSSPACSSRRSASSGLGFSSRRSFRSASAFVPCAPSARSSPRSDQARRKSSREKSRMRSGRCSASLTR